MNSKRTRMLDSQVSSMSKSYANVNDNTSSKLYLCTQHALCVTVVVLY